MKNYRAKDLGDSIRKDCSLFSRIHSEELNRNTH